MQLREVGQVLAGKYRLMRLLGQGRRGAVWQAQHLTLNAPVALKLFDSGQLDAAAEQQFLNEARTAAALRSPHVVQILDYGIAEHTPHIAMELLEGESLAARLERVGHLSPEETARVVQQVGRALARAHDAGVIHGDLKASNVFIVKNDDEELVQVLGFGVAKGERQLLDGPSAVGAGSRELLGAPEYVSPEQLDASAPVDSRGDLWSLGVLAYHCLLGELPFRGESAVDVVPAICSQAPPVPSTRGSVPDGFDDWFARACAPEREARFGSAREAAAAFAALSPGEPGVDSRPARALNTAAGPLPAPSELAVAAATDPCPPPSPPSRELEQRAGAGGSRWRHVMPLLVIAACGGAVFALRQHRVPPEGVTPPGSDGSTSRAASIVTASPALTPPRERVGRRSVAVISLLEPQGRSADAWLGTALADLLRTELESGDQLRTVSQERVGSMQRDLDLPPTQSLERPLLTQIRAILHADMTLIGSYWLLADSRELRINVTLQDTGSGETVATVAESGPASELFAVVSRIGAQVRRKLGADALSPAQLAQVERSLPSDPQARIWYAEGRAKLLRTEYLAATELFAQVAEREPAFPGSHAMAAEAWAALKYDSKAAAAAERARALSSELPRKEQLRAEARAHLRSNRAAQAAELLRSLVTVYPDELDFGIELVRAQARASQFSEASSTIAELHQLPAPLGEDPRIDLLEASVASYLGDQPRQGASARRAFEKAERLGLRSLQAEARVHEADVLFGTGRVREAREAYLDARRRAAEAHDLGGEANALSGLGELEGMTDTQGPEVGREHLQQAIEIYDRIGHLRNAGVAHVALGNAWWTAGRPAQAESEYRLALQRFEATGFETGAVSARSNIVSTLAARGELAAAAELGATTLALARKQGNRRAEGDALAHQAEVLLLQGRVEQARDGYTAALRAYEETHDQTGVSDTQVELSRLLRIAGDAAGARALLTPALAALREAEAADLVENGELLQMLLDLDAREPDRVLQQRAAWSKRFDSPYRAGNQSFAHSRLARALLAKAELAEAQREAGEAVRVTEASDDARPRVEALLTDAQVQAAAGDRAAARARLEQSAELARRAGRAAEYELELELAALDKADGAPGWKAQLAALAKRARGEKFVLYARRAARLGRD